MALAVPWSAWLTLPTLAPGGALLQGHGDDPATDGIEIALKGGQMGPPDFFMQLRAGGQSGPGANGGQQ